MRLYPALHLANALLVALLVAGTALTYDALPERIPRHFSLDGTVDAWHATTPMQAWLLPLAGLGTALLLYGSAWLVPRYPRSIHLPGIAFADLPPATQKRVKNTLQTFLYANATGVLVLFGALAWGTVAAATSGRMPVSVLVVLLVFLVLSVLVLPLFLARLLHQIQARPGGTG